MEDKRLISEERGKKVAEENGIKFFETSAKENINIELAFNTVNIAAYILYLVLLYVSNPYFSSLRIF